jgi:type VII secretion protein EccE
MSQPSRMSQSSSAWPGTGRITLALLVVIPAAMAYPWRSAHDQLLLGVAAAVLIVLFAWWRGHFLTTLLRWRLAMMRRNRRPFTAPRDDTRTTVLLRIGPPASGPDLLPLPLIARYLNRYGIRADKIRITSRDSTSDTARRETWIGLTVSAAKNLAALQARSSHIPLHETAEVAARRLADHLREIGWDASIAAPEDIPRLFTPTAHETWRALREANADYIAAYRVSVDAALPETLAAIRSHSARETWTAVEIAGDAAGQTLAAACAFRTDEKPRHAAPLHGLTAQRANQGPALRALQLLSTEPLDGHTDVPDDLLARLRWPSAATAAAPSKPRHRAATRTWVPA